MRIPTWNLKSLNTKWKILKLFGLLFFLKISCTLTTKIYVISDDMLANVSHHKECPLSFHRVHWCIFYNSFVLLYIFHQYSIFITSRVTGIPRKCSYLRYRLIINNFNHYFYWNVPFMTEKWIVWSQNTTHAVYLIYYFKNISFAVITKIIFAEIDYTKITFFFFVSLKCYIYSFSFLN